MKNVLFGIILCLIFASASYAHVQGYEAVAYAGTSPTIDGEIKAGEWNDAYHFTFQGAEGTINAYVKHAELWGDTLLYVAYKIPSSETDEEEKMDYAKVGIDGWNDNGNPQSVIIAPKQDDMLCMLQRDAAFSLEFWGNAGVWDGIGSSCIAESQNFASEWHAEFEIWFDGQYLIPQQTNGFVAYVDDLRADASTHEGSWPPQPNGDLMDLSTWGDLNWPGQPGELATDVGDNDPGDHGWYYDPDADPYNEMLQIDVSADNIEAIKLTSIFLQSFGSGNDKDDISQIIVINDLNNNGAYDVGETVLGTGKYNSDNGGIMIQLSGPTIPAGGTAHLLIIYTMASSATPGDTFWFRVTSITGQGQTSGVAIAINPNMLSGTKTTVAAPTTGGEGSNSPGDHSWYYDPSGDPYNEMLQIRVKATNTANVQLNSVTVQASGTGNDAEDISTIYLMHDSNNNGIYDPDAGDSIVAQNSYAMDNGPAILLLANPMVIPAGTSVYLIIAYGMADSADVGDTYRAQVTAISATDMGTGQPVDFSAYLPITSARKTTIEKPATPECEGTIALSITPGTTSAGSTVTAAVSGLDTDCSGRTVSIRQYSCTGTQVASCAVGSGCTTTLTAPDYAGTYIYYACLDMNQDQDLADPGEQGFDTLVVQSDQTQCSITNCGGCTEATECFASGCYWCNDVCQPYACPASGCTGSVTVSMPATADASASITATVAGLDECSGRTAYIKEGSCAGTQVSSCTLVADTCTATFTAPATEGNYTYYVCADKNDNGAFTDAGESAFTTVAIEGAGPGPGTGMDEWIYYTVIAIAIIAAVVIVSVSIIFRR